MPAYAIGFLDVTNRDWMAEYGRRSADILARHGGRYLSRGGAMHALEGRSALPTGIVVVEFPSMDAAKSWYSDPEYAELIRMRQSGATLELVVVEGL
jgi:uncharacterized protein (DUF1330 family)